MTRRSIVKRIINKVFSTLGVEIVKKSEEVSRDPHEIYHCALLTKMASKSRINIVVVGANDGKTNDPVYEFARKHRNATSLVLIEPNPVLRPHLSRNYSFHPDHRIIEGAISVTEERELTLYTIRPEYWYYVQPAYAKKRNWDEYRAPTGISSIDKSEVERWLGQFKNLPIRMDELIDSHSVPAHKIIDIVRSEFRDEELDVLQVDVEGLDGKVVASAIEQGVLPGLIYFESKHMTRIELVSLLELMGGKYDLFYTRDDALAVRTSVN